MDVMSVYRNSWKRWWCKPNINQPKTALCPPRCPHTANIPLPEGKWNICTSFPFFASLYLVLKERYIQQTSHIQYLLRLIAADEICWMLFGKFVGPQTNIWHVRSKLWHLSCVVICKVDSAYQLYRPSLVSSQLVLKSCPKLSQPTGFLCHCCTREPKHTSDDYSQHSKKQRKEKLNSILSWNAIWLD